jgi:hypothetical protein
MTSQDPSQSGGEGMITYWLARGGYRGVIAARERFDELTSRDHTARAIATLKLEPGLLLIRPGRGERGIDVRDHPPAHREAGVLGR